MVVRAATERPELTRALGIDVGRWVTPVFGFGVALAALAGVLAAPMRAVNPLMGADLIIVVFAVVVIGGLGSIFGSVAAGFAIGLVQAWGEAYAPALSSQTLVFVLMAVVLLWRPAGLFGREEHAGMSVVAVAAGSAAPAGWAAAGPLVAGGVVRRAVAAQRDLPAGRGGHRSAGRCSRSRSTCCSATPGCCRSGTPRSGGPRPTRPG